MPAVLIFAFVALVAFAGFRTPASVTDEAVQAAILPKSAESAQGVQEVNLQILVQDHWYTNEEKEEEVIEQQSDEVVEADNELSQDDRIKEEVSDVSVLEPAEESEPDEGEDLAVDTEEVNDENSDSASPIVPEGRVFVLEREESPTIVEEILSQDDALNEVE